MLRIWLFEKFYDQLEKIKKYKIYGEKWRQLVYDDASYIHNELLKDVEVQYAKLSDDKKTRMHFNLFLEVHNYYK